MRTMAFFNPFSDVREVPAIIVGNRDLRSLRSVVERHAGGPAGTFVEQLDAELQPAIVVPRVLRPFIGRKARVS